MGLGYTPSEPIRDEEPPEWGDPWDMVPCDRCDGLKVVSHERADRTLVKKTCPECKGKGELLRGNPPESPYLITIDLRYEVLLRERRGNGHG